MRKILTLLILCLSLTGIAQTKSNAETDASIFHFFAGKNTFYFPWMNNNITFKDAVDFIDAHRTEINNGNLVVHVFGYAGTEGTPAQRKTRAGIMSNRVKSEFIYLKKVKEANFLTSNTSDSYSAEVPNAVVLKFVFKNSSKAETKTGASQDKTSGSAANAQALAKESAQKETQKAESLAVEPQKVVETAKAVEAPQAVVAAPVNPCPEVAKQPLYKWALRTNLLHWLGATPNMGIEWRPVPSFSVSMDVDFAPWAWDNQTRFFRVLNVQPQVRYYFGENYRYYVAGEMHMGQLNWKIDMTGHQGDFIGGGLLLGYQYQVHPSFHIDLNIGAGYTKYTYDKYKTIGGSLYTTNRGLRTQIWGLNSAAVNLVWSMPW